MEVSVQPLGERFAAIPGDNLLKALTDRQIPISYSCLSGRCGTCRCKVVSGDVQEAGGYAYRHHAGNDTAGETGADARYVLACQATVHGDCEIELPEVDEVVVHPAKILKATVLAIEPLTHDIQRLVLKPAKPLSFSPGQYATLQFTPDHIRPYSMAGIDADGTLEFHIRRVPGGAVTGYVAEQLKVGDAVRVSGPLGTSYLRTRHEGPMLCVAGGTGLAPVLSIVRGAVARGMTNPIEIYVGARSPSDVYGLEWLRELAARHDGIVRLHVVTTTGEPVVSEVLADVSDSSNSFDTSVVPSDSGPSYRLGHVTDAVAADFASADALAGWRAYLCGAPPMVDAATALLRARGIDAAHIYADAFYANAA
ncbi:Ferredoxin--NAD(P)(+) reductase (naphthalene dioxygenase ferredoxin-specific) [Pandoraea pneumonica]|uniref:Ferredoxin--NAD(P)(+) reductase (Naphthalene dioxygenase ferredoxin-specific) n=1 Tax=Pandoraea pneumonica TaxID=2508299 RepID=A0A5E4WJN8_9BURK|nr:2Fe-2S iron-sulfur cluster-binding protein [Pandoraea pneumonica]VVE24691.1 Ferredoxin--NAD(P)(+) reductase (naphthalene dioxygenase ferredoxin-specific) [Pandoraea pneumonica]